MTYIFERDFAKRKSAQQSVQPTPSGLAGSAGKRVRKSKVGLPAKE
jgi:hypothetical protein